MPNEIVSANQPDPRPTFQVRSKKKNRMRAASPKGSASAFIRKHLRKPTNEIKSLAVQEGFKFNPNLIYVVRHAEKVKLRKKSSPSKPSAKHSQINSAERKWLKETVYGIGSARASELLTEFQSRLERIFKS